MYPIICKIFYCDKCQYYLCQDCEKKGAFHEHNLLVIESKNELKKIKDKENDVLDKNRKEKEKIFKQDNVQNPSINNLNNYPINNISYTGRNLIGRKIGGKIFYYIKNLQI